MSSLSRLSKRDLQLISAYYDGELSEREAARIEARLKTEPMLREALEEIGSTARALRSLPQLRPPRNFRLTRQMAGMRPPQPAYPMLRLATAAAAFALLATIGIDSLTRALPERVGFKAVAEAPPMALLTEEGENEGPVLSEEQLPRMSPEAPGAEGDVSRIERPEMETTKGPEMEFGALPAAVGDETEAAKAGGGLAATPEPGATATMAPGVEGRELPTTPSATSTAWGTVAPEARETAVPSEPILEPEGQIPPGQPWPPMIRLVEIGLGVLLTALLGLTLRAWRKG